MTAVRRKLSVAVGALTFVLALLPASSLAVSGPEWRVDSIANTAAAPGSTMTFNLFAANAGDVDTTPGACPGVECQELLVKLPDGMTVKKAAQGIPVDSQCTTVDSHQVRCTNGAPVKRLLEKAVFPQAFISVEISPTASGTEIVEVTMSGGGAPTATIHDPTTISSTQPPFGIEAFDNVAVDVDGETFTDAGGHPHALLSRTDYVRILDPERGNLWPAETVRDASLELPPGFVGNPTTVGECSAAQLSNGSASGITSLPLCPPNSQVGRVRLQFKRAEDPGEFPTVLHVGPYALYNMTPPPGVAARLGFAIYGTLVTLDTTVRGGGDYGLNVTGSNIPEALALFANHFEVWGVPASSEHDLRRSCPGIGPPPADDNGPVPSCNFQGEEIDKAVGGGAEPLAFLRNPTRCTNRGLVSRFRADSWEDSGDWKEAASINHQLPGYPYPPSEWGPEAGISECDQVPFDPTMSVIPTTNQADSPTGLEVDLEMPQQGLEEPGAISESDLEKAVVKLPEGMSVNPAAADGLGACSSSQIGLLGTDFEAPAPIRFTNQAPNCPDNAKIGTATIKTPLLDHEIETEVFIAAQTDNPFKSLLAIYIAGRDFDSGVVLKLPGRIEADPNTGQLTATFDNNPQSPFTSLHMELFGGPRATLKTSPTCGTHQVSQTLTGWAGKTVSSISSFELTTGPGGSPCPNGAFDPTFSAGTSNPLGGSFSPFSLRLTRQDGTAQIASLGVKLSEGLLGAPAGIPYCPESALASISSTEGTGQAQIDSPACPSASQVGTVTVGAGAGPTPVFVKTGKAYLAGPYKGAPLSLAVLAPAVAGPFDLGTVLVRNALYVDPTTAQVSATSDPIPTILHGVPLNLRDVRVDLDRPRFTLNPTDCDPKAIEASVAGAQGQRAERSQRFQVAGCADLPFKPKLALKLKGATKRTGHPALRAVLTMPPGGANISSASVALPESEFLDQSHIGTICTRVQFAADQCPKRSIYGKATAYSPLLDQPLKGNVYLRSSSNELPDLVADLRGQIRIEVAGRIDTDKRGGIRTTFQTVPDAPVTKFVLEMEGQKKGLLENSRDLCAHTFRATGAFDGQNGRLRDLRPKMVAKCGKDRKAGQGRRRPR